MDSLFWHLEHDAEPENENPWMDLAIRSRENSQHWLRCYNRACSRIDQLRWQRAGVGLIGLALGLVIGLVLFHG